MVKGILADIHVKGPVNDLVREMKKEPWAEFWEYLGLSLFQFQDVGLSATSSDLEIWQRCQQEQLVFITNNRNADSSDSLETTIRNLNNSDCLPVLTVGDLNKLRLSRDYAERVLKKIYEYLFDIDKVRGSGRLFVP
jgi:hypothetical protein